MESTVEVQIARLVDLIESRYISSGLVYNPTDFAQKGQYFTLDVISALAFGDPFGYLEEDDDVFNYIKITSSFIPIMLVLANIPSLAKLLQSRIFRGLLPKESDKLGFGAFIGLDYKFCIPIEIDTGANLVSKRCEESRSTTL